MDGDHNYIPHHDQYHTYDHNNTPSTVTNSLDLLLSNSNIHEILPDQPTVQQSQSAHAEIDWISLLYGSNKYDDDDHEQSPSVSFMAKHDKELRENYGSKNKSKSIKAKKANPPRIAFHTRTADDVLEDGYKWRKYGQKSVKNNIHPRSYFRCSYPTCNVKKQIQRLSKDPSIVVTTYEGIHNHPCAKLMETLSPLIKQLQFLSRI